MEVPENLIEQSCHGLIAAMSALGQKQTYAVHNGMSALPLIATSIAFFGMSALGKSRHAQCRTAGPLYPQ